jgi:hypothetical protein
LVGHRKSLNIFIDVVYECEEIFVSSLRCEVGASYIHGCDLDRGFGLLHFSEWGNTFYVLSTLARVIFPYVVL